MRVVYRKYLFYFKENTSKHNHLENILERTGNSDT